MDNFKKIGIGILIVLFIALGLKDDFIAVNEMGYLGMDVDGRQIFLQTINSMLDNNETTIDSDFYDRNIVSRLLLGEPMRTTCRTTIVSYNPASYDYEKFYEEMLSAPASTLTDIIQDDQKIALSIDCEMTGKELRHYMERYDIKTFGNLLVAFGFKTFDLYANGKFIAEYDLGNQGNTVMRGGILKTTTIGFMPAQMVNDYAYYSEHGEYPPGYAVD